MNWLARWLRPRELDPAQRNAVDEYRGLTPADAAEPLDSLRFVVADVETSGLNPYRDSLISIGALSVEGERVCLGRSFETVLRQDQASETGNILVHGIGGTAQLSGIDPRQALVQFLRFAGAAPLVGFHAQFDQVVIDRAMRAYLGASLKNPWLDLAVLAPALLPDVFPRAGSLDDWLAACGIDNYARHDAVADSLATAELFLVVLAAARTKGHETLADLIALEQAERWLGSR